ncbi:M20/M25/M40 family metallo-hydrolase [Aquincola sp. S2]|uniref:M20/M25/M40 family metallo-hydrolase n=1 Tax=Pseudaquabacterium terrae TaxID=2732868 RepID=A0ABX2EGB4_9BURK|nr:M28 family metallopeptidase [Aquabacterium terrae]NRF67641.1 M20/M25/M40 family metallo-hydrolase [Aquabacterium terrae]
MPHRLAGLGAAVLLSACATPPAPPAEPHRDPAIAALLAEISPQRIEARIRTLAAFETRHTLSETDSPTRGIGAARRWIKAELEACSREAGGRLQVAFDEHLEPAGARVPSATPIVNVVATLPGTQPSSRDRLLVVSGHYDSRASDVMDAHSVAPGANDDASGTAAVMEMACVMARRRFDATLVFMAVAGEEQGLLGATNWAAQARRQGLQVEAMVTNDIIGSPVGDFGQRDARQVRLFADGLTPLLRLALRAPANQSTEDAAAQAAVRQQVDDFARAGGSADFPTHQLGRHLKEAAERHLSGFQVNLIQRPDRYLRGGDHLPFLARGYAAVRFTEPFENFRHQHQNVRTENGVRYGDLPEFVDFGYVADVARINTAGLATLALAPAPPKNARVEVLELTNDTALRWDANNEPDLAGYRIVWRETGSPVWQHRRDVGNVTRIVMSGLSKDNLIFGVQAVDRDGHASLASFPLPLTR